MIELENLNAKRGDFSMTIESLKMNRGEFIAVLGNNGGGKSTFLNVLAGQLSFAGSIRLKKKDYGDYQSKEINRMIGFLPQRTTLNMPFDVFYVILTGRFAFTDGYKYRAVDYEATDRTIEKLDISHLKNRIFNELSGGEKQRVLLARALNRDSEILLLDEPMNGVDLRHQHETIALLKRMNADKTTLVVMHDLSMAVREFQRLLVFSEGSLAYDALRENIDAAKLADIFAVKIDFLQREGKLFINTEI